MDNGRIFIDNRPSVIREWGCNVDDSFVTVSCWSIPLFRFFGIDRQRYADTNLCYVVWSSKRCWRGSLFDRVWMSLGGFSPEFGKFFAWVWIIFCGLCKRIGVAQSRLRHSSGAWNYESFLFGKIVDRDFGWNLHSSYHA